MLINFIKKFEGFSSKVYVCPAGVKTIGYGHVLNIKEHFDVITEEIAEQLLTKDIYQAQQVVLRNIYTDLTQEQFSALTSFTFNLGFAALQRSTLRQKINRNEHFQVPKELMRWVCSCGKIMPGLVRRREAEAELYML
jgi:lysozyme